MKVRLRYDLLRAWAASRRIRRSTSKPCVAVSRKTRASNTPMRTTTGSDGVCSERSVVHAVLGLEQLRTDDRRSPGAADADIDAPEGWNLRHDATNILIATVDSGPSEPTRISRPTFG
jgi:hypothetical protein